MMLPDYVFEVSFEVGNKVGGIHTVVTSKTRKMKEIFGRNYFAIGFYNPNNFYKECKKIEEPNWLEYVKKELENEGIKIYFCKWIVGNNVDAIIIDSKEFTWKKIFEEGKEWINVHYWKYLFWKNFSIDSYRAGYDFEEPFGWGIAVGKFFEKIIKLDKFKNKQIIAHFHEWLSGSGLLYIKLKNLPIKTVFTTHATVVGRTLSSRGENFYKIVEEEIAKNRFFNDNDAYKYFIEAKHLLEKECAKKCDCFTVVSDIVDKECQYVLHKKADIITYNMLDFTKFRDLKKTLVIREKYKEKILDFIKAYFLPYYNLKIKEGIIIFTSGRYEFFNKGIDLFIETLAELNKELKAENFEENVFSFILLATHNKGVKKEVIENILLFKELKDLIFSELSISKEDIALKILHGEKDITNFLSEEALERINYISHILNAKKGKNAPILAFDLLWSEEEDEILNYLKNCGLKNSESDIVKVIYYPSFLSYTDGLLNMDYKEFCIASTFGLFLSRYEPWGYTPFECATLNGITITTNASGFGRKIGESDGIYVVDVLNKRKSEIIEEVKNKAKEIIKMSESERTKIRIKTIEKIQNEFSVEKLIKNYLIAYEIALKK